MFTRKITNNKGFTLVEMIVSIAIFIVVAIVAVGALLKVIDANKKSQSLKTSINNMNFALESISREMRVGTNYYCIASDYTSSANSNLPPPNDPTATCSTPTSWTTNGTAWEIFFYSSKIISGQNGCKLIYAYRFANGTIEKAEKNSCNDVINSSSFHPIISPDVKFELSTVRVVPGDNTKQSYAQFHFKGYSGSKDKVRTYFDLQTTVSQRLPDL